MKANTKNLFIDTSLVPSAHAFGFYCSNEHAKAALTFNFIELAEEGI
jgi:hypothetical protein